MIVADDFSKNPAIELKRKAPKVYRWWVAELYAGRNWIGSTATKANNKRQVISEARSLIGGKFKGKGPITSITLHGPYNKMSEAAPISAEHQKLIKKDYPLAEWLEAEHE